MNTALLDTIWRDARGAVETAVGRGLGDAQLRLLPEGPPVADRSHKAVIISANGETVGLLACSNPEGRDMVARGIERAEAARRLLGEELGAVILSPFTAGWSEGLSYAVYPWRRPLRNDRMGWALQRLALRGPIRTWLRGVCAATRGAGQERAPAHFTHTLSYMAEEARLGRDIRAAAAQALNRIETRRWTPRHALAHNDFWKGNILLPPLRRYGPPRLSQRFCVIDWGGSDTMGYPLFDLARYAESFEERPARLTAEIAAHCHILECGVIDAQGYLLAALGHIGLNLDRFPFERFAELATRLFRIVHVRHS